MENKYKSCTLTDLATSAGLEDVRTFQDWLTKQDLIEMIELGWNPFTRKLKPAVVYYLRNKFVDPLLKQK